MTSPRPKLVLIDGYHNIFRAFYAIRELTNSKGEPTNAVYGFVQMLRKLLRDEAPDYVGVALDVSDVTFRTAKFADYKANRAPMPEELKPQIPQIRRAIEAFRIPILELADYEADDVMGTLARKAAARGLDVVLVTADKDMFQLVGDGVALWHSGRNKLYDARLVEEDFGVPPAQVADVLALMGDAVDNVPGVPGIGEKGAKQLVREHGSVEALLERAGQLTRKAYREGLEQHREQALLSKELVTIHTDLPIEPHLESLVAEPPDVEALRALYAELEFRTLLEELGTNATPAAAERELVEPTDADALATLAAQAVSPIAVALLGAEEPAALAFAGVDGPIVLADRRREGVAEALVAALARWAADPAVELVGYDLKEVLRLAPRRAEVRCARFDLLLAAYLLRTSSHGHPFEEVALERLGVQPRTVKEAGFDRGQLPELGDARLVALARERLEVGDRLAESLRAELATGPAATLYREIEAPLTPLLLRMEETGILLDRGFLGEMSHDMARDLLTLEREIYALAGESFNIQSPQQLGAILFEKLELPAGRRTKKTKSWSTDAETLADLAAAGHVLPERILRFREIAKLKSTYVDALPTMVAADGRIHTRFQQAVAATGRLSSINPNLQNIPIRTEQGQRIRRAFRADEGCLLVVADYSQIELRILAHIAGETAMLQAFAAGEDIHRATAAAMFGCDPGLVNAEQRRAAKTINFGLVYGMSAFGLARQLQISPKEAEQFIAAYFARYAGVERYMRETLERAERDGRVETLWGRARLLPELKHANYAVRENAKRMAINARIQGSAADLLKIAMLAVDRRLRAEHPRAELLLTVHDELVLEAPAEEAAAVATLVKTEMAGAARLDVPLVVDAGVGPTWGDAKH
ncbi:MAG: DNA polymerase I [Thermoanaerobaculia bacterium]|nr:DNA polymerase I [Thermoanaerobaculia bacterium]